MIFFIWNLKVLDITIGDRADKVETIQLKNRKWVTNRYHSQIGQVFEPLLPFFLFRSNKLQPW